MGAGNGDGRDYGLLKDLRVELNDSVKDENGVFSLCFWIYLSTASPLPCTILHQEHQDKFTFPFLSLNEKKNVMLFPLLIMQMETLMSATPNQLTELPSISTQLDFPLKKWVHVGCKVSQNILRLHINGEIAGEISLISSVYSDLHTNSRKQEVLACIVGDNHGLQGYIHHEEVLPPKIAVQDHYVKDPPMQLLIDSMSGSEIEEDNDGIWSIVGGKASCRRNFSLDVVLIDAIGRPLNEELEVVASLLYADNDTPVEETNDAEAPLLTVYDGIEYASLDRPCKLIDGRASCKLKISQLSSKCDNRLFRIKFEISKFGKYPFLEAFSLPIRCISRTRNVRTSSVTWKKSAPGVHLVNRTQSAALNDESPELLHNVVCEAKQSPSSKRVKLGQEKAFPMFNDAFMLKPAEEECNSHVEKTYGANKIYMTNTAGRSENHDGSDNLSSNSENSEATKSDLKSMPSSRCPISNEVVFKYCLGGISERALLLKEIAISASEEELTNFADQVCLFSGCSHHRHQIMIAKRLIEGGSNLWNLLSQNSSRVLWDSVANGVKEQFMKIVSCSTRSLTLQDLEILRRISGCQELVSQENFEKIWCWLYPVAFTLSQDWINGIWGSVTPKWIEGFITKEEAESSLQGPGGFQEPGTFVLRFPTSRSWPHPDAGNLVATYVGNDCNIHHRLLSLDFLGGSNVRTVKSLQEMLLEEPELSKLGRIRRIW